MICGVPHTTELPADAASLVQRARAAAANGADADALHALALIDLVWADTSGKALDRSIQYLEMVTRLDPSAASAFSDLSAAHLARGARRADEREILVALDAATRAVMLQSRDEAAHFDRALALDLLGLDGEAARERRAYLAEDSTSRWAAEVRQQAARTPASTPATAHPPDADASAETLATFTAGSPAEARSFAWEYLLGDWGRAIMSGDSALALARLRAASVVGSTLAREHGDPSIENAVRAIHRQRRDRAATRRLAVAHDRFARAQARTRANDYRAADSGYTAIVAARPASSTLVEWATYGHGNALIYDRRRRAEGERTISALVRRTDLGRRDPELTARGLWALGVLHLRAGRHDAGIAAVRRAQQLFERLGETESRSAMIGLEGEAQLETGDDASGYAGLGRALLELRGYPTSVWRHNVLMLLARAATADGLERAAMSIEDEDAAAADAAGRPVTVVESRLERARSLWSTGDYERAHAALDAAAHTIAALPAGNARDVFQAELDLTVASGPLRDRPARAHALLDSVVDFFAPTHSPAKLIPALVARAGAAVALGRPQEAEADLANAASLYDAERAQMTSLPQRAALLARARAVFEGLAMLRLREGRASDALDAIERGRASFAPSHSGGDRSDSTRARHDALVVDYALVGDTLLAWTVDGHTVALTRSVVAQAAMAETVERTRAALELGAPERALRPDLSRLYDWLVRPLEPRLGGGARTVVIVADGAIGDVPFAALFDARTGRYLVECYATRLAATLEEGLSSGGRAPAPDAALFVANPALDWRAYPTLSSLDGAESEVREAAPLYRRPTFLVGAAADSASVAAALADAELFHFAGHAVLEEWRPERSFLAGGPRGLTAAAIAALDLHRLRLVVLSACETMRSPDRRTGAFTSFSDAFLSAGAGGVVGSLWRVADEPTASLMRELHRAYRRSGDPASALRDAQLALLHSPDAALRSPAAWGAFRYAGR